MVVRFRVAGDPVQVHPLFFLSALAVGARWPVEPTRLGVWFAGVCASVLLHELGHALAYRRLGLRASIALHGLGGTTTAAGAARLTHRQSLGVALAGSAMSFALGGLVLALRSFLPVGQADGLAGLAVEALIWVNFGWGLLNLLPLFPLDGGHALAALLRMRGGDRHERLVHLISGVMALGLLALGVVWKSVWLGLTALVLGVMNLEHFLRARQTESHRLQLRQARLTRRSVPEEEAAALDRLLSELRAAPRSAPPPSPEPPDVPHDPRFVGELLLGSGLAELAIRPLQAAFTAESSAPTGHLLVTALLEAGRVRELERLLEEASAVHLGEETLLLIASRADTAGQPTLATRARELRQVRLTTAPLPVPHPHDSKKPG